jgi:hypothetical protein
MRVPVANRTRREILLGLEPEGDTLPVAPGQVVVVKAVGEGSDTAELEIDIDEDGLITISMMCAKEVWCGNARLR